MNLYQLSSEYETLLDRLQSSDEISEEDMALLLDVQGNLAEKMDAYGIVINSLQTTVGQIELEEKRLDDWKSSLKSNIVRMKDALSKVMMLNNLDKQETEHYRFSFRKSTSTQVEENFVAWAIAYNRKDLLNISDPTPNKTAIKQALEKKEQIPAHLFDNLSLQIK